MVEGAETLSLAASTVQVPVQEWEVWPELWWGKAEEARSLWLSSLVGAGWGKVPRQPPTQSGSQPFGVCPCQSEVENRHVKEITDTFTLVQVVDVIVVSRGWRKTE